MNKFKSIENKKVKQKEKSKFSKSIAALFSGQLLSKDNVVAILPYIFFLTFLAILYIANGYYSERTVRNLYKTGTELKELRSEYITIKSDLNYKSKQSQVAAATEELGIIESTTPPNKIEITEKEWEQIIIEE